MSESPSRPIRLVHLHQVFTQQHQRLQRMAKRYASSSLDSEDLLQDAAERALRHHAQLRQPQQAAAWLKQITRNLSVDAKRKAAPPLVPWQEACHPEAQATPESCGCVIAQIPALGANYAEILTQVYLQGLSLSEFARQRDLSLNTVTVRLHRARQALKAHMLAIVAPPRCKVAPTAGVASGAAVPLLPPREFPCCIPC